MSHCVPENSEKMEMSERTASHSSDSFCAASHSHKCFIFWFNLDSICAQIHNYSFHVLNKPCTLGDIWSFRGCNTSLLLDLMHSKSIISSTVWHFLGGKVKILHENASMLTFKAARKQREVLQSSRRVFESHFVTFLAESHLFFSPSRGWTSRALAECTQVVYNTQMFPNKISQHTNTKLPVYKHVFQTDSGMKQTHSTGSESGFSATLSSSSSSSSSSSRDSKEQTELSASCSRRKMISCSRRKMILMINTQDEASAEKEFPLWSSWVWEKNAANSNNCALLAMTCRLSLKQMTLNDSSPDEGHKEAHEKNKMVRKCQHLMIY